MSEGFLEYLKNHIGEMAGGDEGETSKLAPDIEVIRLRDAFDAFQTQYTFRVGDIVRQKPTAKLYRGFGDNDHAVVVEILADPIIAGLDKLGTPHFRERCDLIIGSLERGHGDDKFCLFHVDSRRFEPVPQDELKLRVAGPVAAQ